MRGREQGTSIWGLHAASQLWGPVCAPLTALARPATLSRQRKSRLQRSKEGTEAAKDGPSGLDASEGGQKAPRSLEPSRARLDVCRPLVRQLARVSSHNKPVQDKKRGPCRLTRAGREKQARTGLLDPTRPYSTPLHSPRLAKARWMSSKPRKGSESRKRIVLGQV